MQKLSGLYRAGKYSEAQQLAAGLLLAYPDDQKLAKVKSLLDKLLASAASTNAVPSSNSTANSVTPVQPAANTNSMQLTGMDRVEYNSLIELGHEAQQTTDLDEQKTLLHRFMDESKPFLEKHPNDMLLWQLRAASAISLNDPLAGYEAGQELLESANMGNDPIMQRLLTQLNLKGWLKKLGWLQGTYNVAWNMGGSKDVRDNEVFVLDGSIIEGYVIGNDGVKSAEPDLKGTIHTSGEISWQCNLPSSDSDGLYLFRFSNHYDRVNIGRESDSTGFVADRPKGMKYHKISHVWVEILQRHIEERVFYPSGWKPVISCEPIRNDGHITIVIPSQGLDPKMEVASQYPVTLTFTRVGDEKTQQPPEQQVQPHSSFLNSIQGDKQSGFFNSIQGGK